MCEAGFPDGIDKDMALILLIINIFLPGVGTLVAACLGDCDGTTVAVGIFQLLTAWLIVGYVWAICWSVNLYKQASYKTTAPTTQHNQPPQPAVVAPPPPGAHQPHGQVPPPPPQQPYGQVPPQNVQQPYGQVPPQNVQQPYGQVPPQNVQQPYGQVPNMPPKFVGSPPPPAPQ